MIQHLLVARKQGSVGCGLQESFICLLLREDRLDFFLNRRHESYRASSRKMERMWVQKDKGNPVPTWYAVSPDFLRRTTNCHLCKPSLLLYSSFFVSLFLSLSLPLFPPPPYFSFLFFPTKSQGVAPGALLYLFVGMREAAGELNRDPNEGTADGISPEETSPPG